MTGKWILSGTYRQEISREPLPAASPQCAARVRSHCPPWRRRARRTGPARHPRRGQPATEAAGGSSGLALFQRAGRGLRLTAAGTRLQAACSEAFAGIEGCVRELRRPATSPALVLGCSGSVLARWMIPRLPVLQAALPGVRLQWSALDGSFTEAQAALDAVLLLAQGPWPRGWQVRELAPERVGVVVAPSHPAAQRLRQAPPSALLQETVLHTTSRPQAWPAWAQAHRRTRQSCSWAPLSNISITCWKQPWPGWARQSRPSRWWPKIWQQAGWSHRGVCGHRRLGAGAAGWPGRCTGRRPADWAAAQLR